MREGDASHFREYEGMLDEMEEKQVNLMVTKKERIHIGIEQGKCSPKCLY